MYICWLQQGLIQAELILLKADNENQARSLFIGFLDDVGVSYKRSQIRIKKQ